MPDGDRIAFWTPRDTGKVKRTRKYGLMGRLTLLGSRLRGGAKRTVIVLVEPT